MQILLQTSAYNSVVLRRIANDILSYQRMLHSELIKIEGEVEIILEVLATQIIRECPLVNIDLGMGFYVHRRQIIYNNTNYKICKMNNNRGICKIIFMKKSY